MPDPSYKKYCRKEDDIFYHMVMTNTKTKTKTKTYAIFLKSREFRYIKYDQIRPDQVRPGQRREEFNLAVLILELAFLFTLNLSGTRGALCGVQTNTHKPAVDSNSSRTFQWIGKPEPCE